MSESIKYSEIKNIQEPVVYVIQEIPGTRTGNPKINIRGASKYGLFHDIFKAFS